MRFFISLLCFALSFSVNAALGNKVDGEVVNLSGKVTSVSPDSFQLKVKDDKVLVEMDDFDTDADGYKLVVGDKVVVTGLVDKNFLEKKKIEASSVYVKGLNTYFYASPVDEEGGSVIVTTYLTVPDLPDNASVDLQGKVVKVNGDEFTVDTGIRKIKVDTDNLIYNPLDEEGVTKINVGDRVRVSGIVDEDFFEKDEVQANFVRELGALAAE